MVKTKKKYLVLFKQYDFVQSDKLFANFSHQHHHYPQHRSSLTEGTRISFNDHYPPRLSNDNPSFSTLDKIGTCQQLQK